jgi:hypothetical protein
MMPVARAETDSFCGGNPDLKGQKNLIAKISDVRDSPAEWSGLSFFK